VKDSSPVNSPPSSHYNYLVSIRWQQERMVIKTADEPFNLASESLTLGKDISSPGLLRQIQSVQNGSEHCLVVFRRQYLQRLDLSILRWPEKALLCTYDVQIWLFDLMVKTRKEMSHPSYDRRFAKMLVSRIEAAVENTEEPVRVIYNCCFTLGLLCCSITNETLLSAAHIPFRCALYI